MIERRYDVSLGLAIARSGVEVTIGDEYGDDELVFFGGQTLRIGALRGPHVKELEFDDERCSPPAGVLNDHRVAFGIGMAQRGPWKTTYERQPRLRSFHRGWTEIQFQLSVLEPDQLRVWTARHDYHDIDLQVRKPTRTT